MGSLTPAGHCWPQIKVEFVGEEVLPRRLDL